RNILLYILIIIIFMFFFFQAEDGIRDFHVTGVQTCALPIYAGCTALALTVDIPARNMEESARLRRETNGECMGCHTGDPWSTKRSEERRVGKEGRSRWWEVH